MVVHFCHKGGKAKEQYEKGEDVGASILPVGRADILVEHMFDTLKDGEQLCIAVSQNGDAYFQKQNAEGQTVKVFHKICNLYGYGGNEALAGAFMKLIRCFSDDMPAELERYITGDKTLPKDDLLVVKVA